MQQLKLTIQIKKSPQQVFAFVLDPRNTPKWIEFITFEETNEWPPRLGTIYRNKNTDGRWSELEMTAFEPDRMFVLTQRAAGYHVRYTLTKLDKDRTELEYTEWVDNGSIAKSFTQSILQKLKEILEAT